MNRKRIRDKLRAVFLTALMITSVFAGTVAFTGTVAANASGLSVSPDPVQSDGVITVNGTAGNAENDVSFKIEDEDGSNATIRKNITNEGFSVDIDLGSLNFTGGDGNLSEGWVTVSADENSSFETSQDSTTFAVDDTAPTISNFEVTNASGSPKITVASSENLTAIDVTVVSNRGTTTLNLSDFQNTSNTYTATLSDADGDYRATLNTASDGANDGASSQSDFVLIDESDDGLYSSESPTSAVSDNQTRVTADLGTGYSDIAVTIKNGDDGVVYRGTTDDSGIYYTEAGKLIVDPAGSDVPNLPDGSVTVGVSATDGSYSYDDWSFTVDTKGPTFNGATLDGHETGSRVASKTPTFTVNVSDAVSGVSPFSVSVTVTHDGTTETYDDSADGVNFDGTELTVNSSGSDVMDFSQGEVTYVVSAEDSKENYNESSFTFTVDTVNPTVERVTIEETPVNASNVGDTRNVTVEFSEPMDTSVRPDVAINVDGKNAVKNGGFVTAKTDAWSDDMTTWRGTVVLTDESTDAVANVSVASAKDLAGLDLNASNPEGTFVYDTKSPSASTNFSASELEGTLDLTEQFDVNSEAGASVTYEYNTNASGGFPAEDYQTVASPESFDTTQFDEGDIDLKVTVVDDVGNSDAANGTVLLDNVAPDVTSNLDEGQKVYGDLDLDEAFDLTDAESVTYKYNDSDMSGFQELTGNESFYNASTNVIDTTKLADSTNGTLGLRVEIDDAAGNEANETVNVSVNNIDIQNFAFDGIEGESSATISFGSNAELSDVEIVVSQDDDYFEGVEDIDLSLGDFVESYNGTTNTYNYTATIELPRDGSYMADFDSANATDGQKLVDSSISDDASVDGEDPHVIDAWIVDANDTSTQVRVEFNEPVSANSPEAVIGADEAHSSELLADTSDAASGHVVFNVSGHFQTGDSPELNVSDGAFDEAFFAETQNATSSDDATVVHTLKLNLEEGHNVVSVPAASGTVDLTELDALSANDTVWAYDGGEWLSYTPGDNQSDFTTLEGGQGYIFVMDASATIDVNVYNQPGSSGNVASATPGSEDVHEGWNLLGHWQEGSQSVGDALSTIGSEDYGAVYEQTQNGELSFSVASDLDPGEGYWVFVTEDDGDAYGEHAYAT